jgi:putative peptidoglycan lipid II flippase
VHFNREIVVPEDPGLRQIGLLMLPAVVGVSATQINIMVDNQLASLYGNGPISYLSYAFRLMQLPIGLFGIALATVTMSAVSHLAAQNEILKLKRTILVSLRLAACLTFPATVGLIIFRAEIIRLLYESERFSPFDTWQTSRVLLFYAFALFSYSAVKIIVPAFYALNNTKTPVRASITTVVFKIAINLLLIMTPLKFLGLALATALASWLNMFLLLRKLDARPIWNGREIIVYLRILLAALMVGGVALIVFHVSQSFWGINTRMFLALNLGSAIAAGTAATIPLLRLFRVQEAQELSAVIHHYLGRVKR